ncbi:unnamed protein product [Periconia digitata]|uniref:Uncharacterized protein n=1 Tax=Periconia digitata TaxID=1303443 RepID=A0A9W4XVW1_9PLEO|nr:unnamed protein product [Periconia digitata]
MRISPRQLPSSGQATDRIRSEQSTRIIAQSPSSNKSFLSSERKQNEDLYGRPCGKERIRIIR